MLAGITYGDVNPGAIEEIAKSQKKPCDPTKIVNGKRTVCKEEASTVVSPFPTVA